MTRLTGGQFSDCDCLCICGDSELELLEMSPISMPKQVLSCQAFVEVVRQADPDVGEHG